MGVSSIRALDPSAEPVFEPSQGVHLAFLTANGVLVELIEPAGDDSPISRGLRQGVKLLHLCFEVPDLDRAIAHSRQQGFHRIRAPQAVGVFGERRIAWVFSRQYGLFELLEAS
jgi:methylmalonyl-CoA/ethylmalonyl-CoA epimerase